MPLEPGIDYIGVGVGGIIVDGQGRLFMARRGALAKPPPIVAGQAWKLKSRFSH